VSCNGASATVAGSAFSCTVPLNSVSNSVTVIGTDLAGNSATATVSVSVSMSAPTSLQITPGPATMQIGSNQSFTAVDQTGTRRPDASWSVSNTSIATLASDGSGTLTGIAAGQVTLTATIGSVSGQTQVTVLAGSSLTAGTVLWSAPSVSGFTAQQIVQAMPTVNGPDLYSIETDSSSDVLVRAFTADGRQLWQSSVIPTFYGSGVGDNSGGLLLTGANATAFETIDINPQTAGQNWQYSPAPVSGVTPSIESSLAVGLDGTVYFVEEYCSYNYSSAGSSSLLTATDCLNGINGSTGALVSQVTLPTSYGADYVGPDCDVAQYSSVSYTPGSYSAPVVAPDGSVYVEAATYQSTFSLACDSSGETASSSYGESLLLLKNGAQFQTLGSNSIQGDPFIPVAVIPDGNGGVLATTCFKTGYNVWKE
jgi:Bacterial Ig-like domain (group 2)/Glucodextranase, domain B